MGKLRAFRGRRFCACAATAALALQLALPSITVSAADLSFTPVEDHAFTKAEIQLNGVVSDSTGYLQGANVAAYRGEESDLTAPAEEAGKACWSVDAGSEDKFIYLNVDDYYLTEKNLSLIAEVEYLDAGTGTFRIQYDKYNANFANDKYANSADIQLTDSGEWKTAKIRLDSAYLMNRQAIGGAPAQDTPFKRTADLRIRAVAGTLYVSSVTLYEAVEITGTNASHPGNIFTDSEEVSIPLALANATGADDAFQVTYTVRDSRGGEYETQTLDAFVENGGAVQWEIPAAAEKYGVYYLDVVVKNGEGHTLAEERISFSRIAQTEVDTESSPYFGLQTHLVKTIFEENLDVVDTVMDIVAKSGAQVIRDEMYWGMAEPEKDNFEFKPQWERYIEKCEEYGVEPSLILSYGNKCYLEPGEEGTPTPGTAEQIAAFANYAKQMATHYKGKIKQYEVWNEWNGGMNNRPGDNASGIKYFADTYTALLKATYTAIKSVDPDARVVGCVSAGANPFYVESVVAAGGLDYMDAVSYHPYNYPSVPDRMATEVSTFEGLRKLGAILKRYGEEKPLIISEQGWPIQKPNIANSVGCVTEQAQASYMMRLFTLGLAYGAEQVILYDLQDDGTYGGREQNFGLIEHWRGDEVPYAAKESYVALNNITRQLRGVEFVKEYSINQDLRAYQFYRPSDDKDVVVLWGVYNSRNVRWTGTSAAMEAFDIFGNPTSNTWVGTDPIYLVGDAGSFDIDDLVTERWYAPQADASHNIRDMAENGTYKADSYLSSAPWFEGMTMNTVGGVEVPEFILRGARKGWLLQKPTEVVENADYAVLADIDESVMFQQEMEAVVEVEYFDEAAGEFYVYYDSVDGKKLAGTVTLTGSNEWKTASFTVTDAYFGDRLDGGDILISLQAADGSFGIDKLVFACVRAQRKTVSANLGQAAQSNGLDVWMGGHTAPDVQEEAGRTGWTVSNRNTNSQVIYGDVSDNFIYDAQTKIEIEVTYFDSAEEGAFNDGTTSKGFFRVGYNTGADKNAFTNLPGVDLTGTNTWKTAVFTVDAASLSKVDGPDIQVTCFVDTKAAGKRVSPVPVLIGKIAVRRVAPVSASVVMGEDTQSRYLEVMPSGNATFSQVKSYYSESLGKDVSVLETNRGHSSPNIFLLVNDNFLYNAQDCTVTLRLTYWDSGNKNITIQYDAAGDKNKKLSIPYTNTGDFRTVDITLEDALFANRRAQKSDILISCSAGDIAVSKAELLVESAGERVDRSPIPVAMDTTPPDPVVNLQAEERDGGVFLRWENPADGTGANATMEQLRVYMLVDGVYKLVNYKMDSPANNTEGKFGFMYIGGLTNGTEYTFMVTAADKWLNESEGVTIQATPRAGAIAVESPVLTDGEGNVLETLGDRTEAAIQAQAGNTTDTPAYVTMLIAEYDETGAMVNLWQQERLLMNDTPEATLTMGLKLDAPLPQGHTLKAFIWDNLDDIKPWTSGYRVP